MSLFSYVNVTNVTDSALHYSPLFSSLLASGFITVFKSGQVMLVTVGGVHQDGARSEDFVI